MRLLNKVALITGASRGIGREIALAFAREGADIGINYLKSAQAAEKLAEEIKQIGRQAFIIQADVSQVEPVRTMIDTMIEHFGRIDILVNNAGVLTQSLLKDMTVETWDNMIASDLRSVFLCTRFTLPYMIQNKSGRILNVASQLGQKGGVDLTHYCAAKAGVIGLTKALAREVGVYNITVNAIAPGPIDTDMVAAITEDWKMEKRKELPIGRFGRVEEVAPTAVFLASEPDGNIYTGQTLGPNSGDVML